MGLSRLSDRASNPPPRVDHAITLGVGLMALIAILEVAAGNRRRSTARPSVSGAEPTGADSVPRQRAAREGEDRAITVGLGLTAVVALIAMAAGVPYQVRLWLLVPGLVFAPGCLLLRAVFGRYALGTFAVGVGVGVAWLMVIGQAMLIAHAWLPGAAAYVTVGIGLTTAIGLVGKTR